MMLIGLVFCNYLKGTGTIASLMAVRLQYGPVNESLYLMPRLVAQSTTATLIYHQSSHHHGSIRVVVLVTVLILVTVVWWHVVLGGADAVTVLVTVAVTVGPT